MANNWTFMDALISALEKMQGHVILTDEISTLKEHADLYRRMEAGAKGAHNPPSGPTGPAPKPHPEPVIKPPVIRPFP